MNFFPQLVKTKTGLLTNLIMAGATLSTAISYSNIALATTNNNPIKKQTPLLAQNITSNPDTTNQIKQPDLYKAPSNIATLNQSQKSAGLLLPQPIAQQPTPPPVSPELQQLRQQYLLTEPATLEVATLGAAAAPGSSSGTPTAFGASWGRTFAGIGFQGRTRYTDDADGSISVGMGFGDAQKSVGVEVTLAVLSLLGDDAFERGGFSFKVHRQLPENFAVALGIENAIVWGETDAGSSVYGVVSKIFPLKEKASEPFSQITASLGLGGGRFRSENDINNDEGSVNIFGSIGVRVAEPVSIIADWTGQDLTLGASIAPFKDIPLVITPAIADITGNAGDGARFILGIGYNYSFPTGNR
ncbi:hypothetical protein NG798_08750 [Ancylothrix sp. C2]|uniref:hypothetical protein n=1 Tax=Ancylothrix sp. D3o TaxID=2953691 RepID=UPI0021BA8086|nr:hypothetical protein [Ancylothrix sp. D3o]MCT7949874.1 hypothetical protein [Ancylothrix sp. D3o]